MTLQYRKLTETGDYSFGQGPQNFHSGVEAVAQAVKTRMQLYLGNFWRDVNDGLPVYQKMLGSSGSTENIATVDAILQERVKGTTGVQNILSYSSSFSPDTRKYSFKTLIQTDYSVTTVQGNLS